MKTKDRYKNPWKTISSREVYKNDWLRLREDQVITPGGKPGIYGVVETSPAIAIVPLTDQLDTYLVGQYRYALDTYSWEIPEGGGHRGETPEQSARRELKEETGLEAQQWKYLGELNTSNSICNEIGHVFLAEQLSQGEAQPEHTEDITVKKVPFQEVYEMVRKYEITDALAIIAVYRVYDYLLTQGRL